MEVNFDEISSKGMHFTAKANNVWWTHRWTDKTICALSIDTEAW